MYTLQAIDNLMSHYIAKGGEVITIKEGSLGYGTTLLKAEGLKTAVIKEKHLNEWSSGHTVRLYNVTPKIYQNATN